jgi:hypothetical protein
MRHWRAWLCHYFRAGFSRRRATTARKSGKEYWRSVQTPITFDLLALIEDRDEHPRPKPQQLATEFTAR